MIIIKSHYFDFSKACVCERFILCALLSFGINRLKCFRSCFDGSVVVAAFLHLSCYLSVAFLLGGNFLNRRKKSTASLIAIE